MHISFWQYLIVCPLALLGGFVDAVAGGGGLITLPAYLIAGLPTHYALGTNKLSAGMGSTIATVKYALNGYVPWKYCLTSVICALLGSSLGANLALLVADFYFKIIILVVLPLTAVYVVRGKAMVEPGAPLPTTKAMAVSAGISLVIGMYDGFYGPGTGIFLILLLTAVAHLSLKEANGMAKMINLATNYAATAVFIINGTVIYPLALTAGAFSIVGSYVGAKVFEKKGVLSVKPLMIVVISIFFIKVLWELINP